MNIRKIALAASLLAVFVAGTVLSAGALTPVKVSSFSVAYASGQIKSTTRALTFSNRPLAGAKVQISFEKEGLPVILRSGMTNALGYARVSAAVPAGSWTVCVEEITKIGYEYNPLVNKCAAIRVP
jgi:hypothetical protein